MNVTEINMLNHLLKHKSLPINDKKRAKIALEMTHNIHDIRLQGSAKMKLGLFYLVYDHKIRFDIVFDEQEMLKNQLRQYYNL